MDKENEFEVIDTLNKFASLTFLYGGRICFFDEQLKKYQKAVKDMLNLYKEEKQAVRTKIIGKIDSVSLDDLIGDKYISKDKIREIFNNKIMKEKQNIINLHLLEEEDDFNNSFAINAVESKINELIKLEKELLED